MRVVITGGSGFIGRALTRSLAQDGHKVVILTRQAAGKQQPAGVELVAWDGRTGRGWAEQLQEADALVNLAGENLGSGYWTEARKRRILESRLRAGEACLDALNRVSRRPAVFVQASAVGFYGDRGDASLDETAAPGKGFLADVARQWEASTQVAEALGLRRVVVRSAIVFGHGGALEKMLPAFRSGLGGALGSGRQYFPWIHLDDEVGAIRFLMDHPEASGPYNLAAPQAVRQEDLAKALGQVLHRPTILRAPAGLLRLALGEMAREMFLSSALVVPRRLLEMGYVFRFPTLAAALEDLLGGGSSGHA